MENHKYAFIECNNILEHSIYSRPDHNELINKKIASALNITLIMYWNKRKNMLEY